jgi:hypothetical protein
MDSLKLTQIVVTLVIRVRDDFSPSLIHPAIHRFLDAHFLLEKHGLHAHASIFVLFSYHQYTRAGTPYVQHPAFAAVTT